MQQILTIFFVKSVYGKLLHTHCYLMLIFLGPPSKLNQKEAHFNLLNL